jgi:Ca2+-transporting ATPase
LQQDWYNKTNDEVAKELSVTMDYGLTMDQANERIKKYGYNELKEKKKETLFQKILDQLKDYLVIILIVASIISAFIGEIADAIVIIAIVIVNAVLGVVQEGKAEKSLEALKKMSAPNARVMRNGRIETIPARQLVPGDVISIETGDILPADIRIIESSNLKIDEASLTGESVAVEKSGQKVLKGKAGIGDRVNMGYTSTIVTYGHGKGAVIATGQNTEIGKIAGKIQDIDNEETPLQRNLSQLGKWLGTICLAVCAVVFAVGMLRGGSVLKMFMESVSLAVAAIPEGLPAVVTIVLALGMNRMVKRNAIVRKLVAVETLGCVDVICSDKTGTLTQNEMTVTRIYSGKKQLKVTGQGYDPTGEFIGKSNNEFDPSKDEDFKMLLSIGLLCNDATLDKRDDNSWSIMGDPTEGSLIVTAEKAGYDSKEANKKYPRIDEIPFDSGRKMMTTFHNGFKEGVVSFTKGAPDIVLKRCTKMVADGQVIDLTDEMRKEINEANSSFAKAALRVLAFAYREFATLPDDKSSGNIENNMIFVGLMGMIDPARVEAKPAIEKCRNAGIKPVMITGDYKDTAVAIAKELKLMGEGDGVLTGQELENMSDEELQKKVETTSVYARVSPEHKVRIVDALEKNGHIVSMTGDGVNDAMALKKANIGVAMGITGTDVAKETSDMILTDDNFASIVSAVEEGRIIYSNIRKFVYFLLSCNVAEILIIFLSILIGNPMPLTPIQLLWLNLVTDSFPALALGTEKGEPDIMDMKPRKSTEPILNKQMIVNIVIQSIVLTFSVLSIYSFALGKYPDFRADMQHMDYARTYAFTVLVCAELVMSYTSRSERYNVFKLGLFSNKVLNKAFLLSFALMAVVVYVPFLRPIFGTIFLHPFDLAVILIPCILPFISGELIKAIYNRIGK